MHCTQGRGRVCKRSRGEEGAKCWGTILNDAARTMELPEWTTHTRLGALCWPADSVRLLECYYCASGRRMAPADPCRYISKRWVMAAVAQAFFFPRVVNSVLVPCSLLFRASKRHLPRFSSFFVSFRQLSPAAVMVEVPGSDQGIWTLSLRVLVFLTVNPFSCGGVALQ